MQKIFSTRLDESTLNELERATRKLIPDPAVGPNGDRSAGAEGPQDVIERARWTLAPATPTP